MKEVDRELHGAMKRRDREMDQRLWQAWHMVALDRTKKLPALSELFSRSQPEKRKQSTDEMLFAMKGLFLAFGGNPDELKGSNDQPG